MGTHIDTKKGAVADTVLLPGDPLRAEYMAKHYLKGVIRYNTVRGMFGFTGKTLDGKRRISIQGSGIGMPSLNAYVTELVKDYGVHRIIRTGTAGSLQKNLRCRSVVAAIGASTDSGRNDRRFEGMTFAPTATPKLLFRAHQIAEAMGIPLHIGNVFATDTFYDESNAWKVFAKYGVLAVEMESAELYTLASRFGIQALSLLTISNNLITGESLAPAERERTLTDMTKLAIAL